MGRNKRQVPKIRPGEAAKEKLIEKIQAEHKKDPQSIQFEEIRQRVESKTTTRRSSMSKSMHQLEFIRLRNYGGVSDQKKGMASSVAAFQVKITRDVFDSKQRAADALAAHKAKPGGGDSPSFKRNKIQMPSRVDSRMFKKNVQPVQELGITVRETEIKSPREYVNRRETDKLIGRCQSLSSDSLNSVKALKSLEKKYSKVVNSASKQSSEKKLNPEQLARKHEQERRMFALEKAKLSLAGYQKKQWIKHGSPKRNRLNKHSSVRQGFSSRDDSMFDERSCKDTVDELQQPMRQHSAQLNIQNLAPDSSDTEDSDSASIDQIHRKSTFYKTKMEKSPERIQIQGFDQQRPGTQQQEVKASHDAGIISPITAYDSYQKKENKATFFINTQKTSENVLKPTLTGVIENIQEDGSHYFITEPDSPSETQPRCQFSNNPAKQQSKRHNQVVDRHDQIEYPETVYEEPSVEGKQESTNDKSGIVMQNSSSATKLQQQTPRFVNNQRISNTARGGSRQKMSRLGPRGQQDSTNVSTARNYRLNHDYSSRDRIPILTSTRASELPSSRFHFTPSSGALRNMTPFSPLGSHTNSTSRQSFTLKEYQSRMEKITKLLDPQKPQPPELVEVLMPDAEHPLADLPLEKLRKVQDGISRGVPIQNTRYTESERPMQSPNSYLLSPRAFENEKLHHRKRLHWLSQYSKADKMMANTDRIRKGRTPLAVKYPNLPKKFENERLPNGLLWPHNKPRLWVNNDPSDENRGQETGESQCTVRKPSARMGIGKQIRQRESQLSIHDTDTNSACDSDSKSSQLSSINALQTGIGGRQNSKIVNKKQKDAKNGKSEQQKEDKEVDLFKEDKMLKADPIMKSELLYRHILLAGIKHAKELFLKNDKAECQSVMFDLLKIAKQAFDMPSALRLHLCIAETWVSRDENRRKEAIGDGSKKPKDGLHEAIKNCQVVLLMNERLEVSELDNEALRITYTCLMKQGKYKEARRSLKMCLERSWLTDNSDWELHVYEKLALCHFYEGNMDKAEFYLMRRELGHSEPEGTETRAVYKNIRNNYKLSKTDRFSAKPAELKKTIFDEFYNHFIAATKVIQAKEERERRSNQKKAYAANQGVKKPQSLMEKLKEAQDYLDQQEQERIQQEQQKQTKGPAHLKMIACMEDALKGKSATCEEIMNVPLEVDILQWSVKDEMYSRLESYVDSIVSVRDSLVNASNSSCHKYIDSEIQDELQAAREQQTHLQQKEHDENRMKPQEENKCLKALAKKLTSLPKFKRELHIPLEVVIDNPMQELPSPTDERTGDQIVTLFGKKKIKTEEFVSVELLELVPHLFTSFLKKGECFKTNQMDYRDSMKKSMDMGELMKRFRAQRSGESRPNVYLSHLSPCFHERYVSVKGEIKLVKQEKVIDEKDKIEYQTKHFLNFEKILQNQIEKATKKLFDFTPLIQSQGVRIAIYGAKKLHELMRDRRMKFTNLAAKRDVGIRKKGTRRAGFTRNKYPANRMNSGLETASQVSGKRSSDHQQSDAGSVDEPVFERKLTKVTLVSKQNTMRVQINQNRVGSKKAGLPEPQSPGMSKLPTQLYD